MNLSAPRIFLALIAVGAVYLYFTDDEPAVAPNETKYQQLIAKPAITPPLNQRQYIPQDERYRQAPPSIPPTYSHGFGQQPGVGQHWDSQFPDSHFRPLDQSNSMTGGSQSGVWPSQPENRAFSYGSPSYDYPDYRYQGHQPSPNSMLERFRPWDEKRQSKRWHGNYQRMSTWPEQLAAPNRSASYLRLADQDR